MTRMLWDAGRLIDRHSMVWLRRLEVPLERIWTAISTPAGLSRWWTVGAIELDLRPGGTFKHDWAGTVIDVREQAHIEIEDIPLGTGGMRLGLRPDEGATLFSFLDTWGAHSIPRPACEGAPEALQPGGRGTPWAGAAADWHRMVDRLETDLTGRRFEHSRQQLVGFYGGYLADHFTWLGVASRRRGMQ